MNLRSARVPVRLASRWILALVAAASLLAGVPSAATGRAASAADESRLAHPEDRYAMAGGCYGVTSLSLGKFVTRSANTFAATAADLAAGEPFHFQATDLGSYLLFGTAEDFLAGGDGGPAAAVAGPGTDVIAAAKASEAADWEITERAAGGFTLALPGRNQVLSASPDGSLTLVAASAAGDAAAFGFELTSGCATFPEVEVNVDGEPTKGASPDAEVRGFFDTHAHLMAFEFIGGRSRCGRPWHPYGVEQALVDCPDHEPGGYGAVLEDVVSRKTPGQGHDTVGWPTFRDWPAHDSLTHEQTYYKWIERAWRGGLRMVVNLFVDNAVLCEVYPYKKNSCDEMDSVRLQHQRIHEYADYIDAQSGGPGEGWFRIVTDPVQARRVINDGKLAVVLGIETSEVFGCRISNGRSLCTAEEIDEQLQEVYDLGVRQMELVNKFDNALSGVAGDGGDTGLVVNSGNKYATGRYWDMETCDHAHDHPEESDKTQHTIPGGVMDRDALAGEIFRTVVPPGTAPAYSEGPHCNRMGLTALGEHTIRRMIQKGMIFDPDHMSVLAREQSLNLLEAEGYSGVVSSHGWSTPEAYRRILRLGGMIGARSGGTAGFVQDWRDIRSWASEGEAAQYYFGLGFGADTNGFAGQPGPHVAEGDPVTYPFAGFGGTVINQQVSGERVYDINADGVAHYGLYPDWWENLRKVAGDQIITDMLRGPEAYLQMWERAEGLDPQARPVTPTTYGAHGQHSHNH